MFLDVSNRKTSALRSAGAPVASIVVIDKQEKDRSNSAELLVTAGDLLQYFPEDMRRNYRRIADFSRVAGNLSHFVTVTGELDMEAAYVEGRSFKVPRKVFIKGEEYKLLFELKGTGYQWSRNYKRTPLHGFPVKDNEDSVYFNRKSGTVKGAESVDTGLLSLANGMVLGLFYMAAHNIPLTAGLRYGGVTIPLAVRKSDEITSHIHSFDAYKGEDDFGVLVLSSPTFERQQFSNVTESHMQSRARSIKFLLQNKVFYESKSCHPQQFGSDHGALFPIYDFGDMIFANRDIPERVLLQSEFNQAETKSFSRKEVWTHITYNALGHHEVNDGITPAYEVRGIVTEEDNQNWKNNIKVFFEELLSNELENEQIERLIELYPYFHNEINYFIAEYFANKEDSALTKAMTETSIRIMKDKNFVGLDQYDMFGENEMSLESVSEDIDFGQQSLYRKIKEYVLQGTSSESELVDPVFHSILSLIIRVNQINKVIPTGSGMSIYTYVRNMLDSYRLEGRTDYLRRLLDVNTKELSDVELLTLIKNIIDSEYSMVRKAEEVSY